MAIYLGDDELGDLEKFGEQLKAATEPSPPVYFNQNVGAYDDQLGHFSYDDGATWGPARSYAAAPAPVSTQGALDTYDRGAYSLNTPAFNDYNIQTLSQDEPQWDSATQGYRDRWGNYSYDGGVTWGPARYYAPPPVSMDAALGALEPAPSDRASFIDYDYANDQGAGAYGQPWSARAAEPEDDGGLWGGFKNAAGMIAAPATGLYGAVNELADRYTGSTQKERLNTNISGNQIVDIATGGNVNLWDLPMGLGYATDMLNPATVLTAGLGPNVPIVGSTFGGNFAKRLAGEVAVGAAGYKGSEVGAEYAPEVIPNYQLPNVDAKLGKIDLFPADEMLNYLGTDQGQAMAGGILGGLAGGIGAYGGVKGLEKALPDVGKAAVGYGDDVLRNSMLDMGDMTGLGPGRVTPPEDAGMVFAKGLKKGEPERTVIPDSKMPDDLLGVRAQIDAKEKALAAMHARGVVFQDPEAIALRQEISDLLEKTTAIHWQEPRPLATERLWFHSTRDMKYDLPDPDMAVGTQTGITQGPGIYMAADPAKSAGNYGPRTFVTEFDGKTLDLTKQVTPDMPVFEGGPSWNKIRDDLAAKLDGIRSQGGAATVGDFVRDAFDPTNLDTAQYAARADLAAVARNADGTFTANGYVYKQALIQAVEGSYVTDPLRGMTGRFAGLGAATNRTDLVHGVVQNHLADEGVDALFHHSPRADGDVLIVLNGAKARVVADVKNAPEAVKAGSTLKDIRRGAIGTILKQPKVEEAGVLNAAVLTRDGRRLGQVQKAANGQWDAKVEGIPFQSFATRDEAVSWVRSNAPNAKPTSIRTFRDIIDNETGEIDLGAFVNAGSVARKRILDSLADRATREGRPTGGIYDTILPTEKVKTGLMRQYEGKTGTAGLQLQRDLDNGNRSLKDANIGRMNGRNLQVEPKRVNGKVDPNDEIVQLYKALHGEGDPPDRLRTIYNDLKRMVAEETDDTLKANKDFVLKDDYFYRGWKAPKETRAGVGKGQVGAKPGYQKPRVDATFSELIAEGWEPISWNPYEMASLRRYAGVQFREQKALVESLKATGLAVPVEGATPVGWRVPKVGPAFEGKPYAFIPETAGLADQVGAKTGYTKQFAVPEKLANEIENVFGRTPDMGAILNTVAGVGQKAKQLKLVASLFQQVDFTTRQGAAGFAGAIDSLIAGEPLSAVKKLITLPSDFAKIPISNVSGARQRQIRDMILDPKPLFKERPGVSLKSISDAGWSTSDITVVNRSIRKSLEDMLRDPSGLAKAAGAVGGDAKIVGAPMRRLKAINEASQRGLFEGVYPQAQATSLKKFIVPRIMRQHPDWSDAQISAAAATEVNKMFSTLGNFQQTVKNPVSKKLLSALIFSTNETESLIKQAGSTVLGPNKLLWSEYTLGAMVFLSAVANMINYAATGEPLDLGDYSPVKKDPYSPLGIGYNNRFMAPEVPFLKGRNNTPINVDLMGQLDTVFRLLDPQGFIEARENVLPRAAMSQLEGEDFFGRPLKGPKERISQAAADIFEPIGASQLRGALNIGPENEGRLGDVGQAIQASGINLRGETTAAMKDRIAMESQYGVPWNKLSKTEQDALIRENEAFRKELETRRDEAVATGNESAIRQKEAADLLVQLTGQQTALDARLSNGEISFEQWHDRTEELKDERYARNDQIWHGVEFKPGQDKVLNGFYDAINKAERGDGSVDWDKVDAYRATLDEKANKWIDDNTGILKIRTPQTEKYEANADKIRDLGYWDVPDKVFPVWAQHAGVDVQGKTPDQFFGELRVKAYQQIKAKGLDDVQAQALTGLVIKEIRKDYDEAVGDVRKAMREKSPELMRALIEAGYYEPGKDATKQLLAGVAP